MVCSDKNCDNDLMSESVVESGMSFVFLEFEESASRRKASSDATKCCSCEELFSTTLRRHHCRQCHNVITDIRRKRNIHANLIQAFCYSCANDFKVLPQTQRELAEQVIGVDMLTKVKNTFMNVMTGKPVNAVRICFQCGLQLNKGLSKHVMIVLTVL